MRTPEEWAAEALQVEYVESPCHTAEVIRRAQAEARAEGIAAGRAQMAEETAVMLDGAGLFGSADPGCLVLALDAARAEGIAAGRAAVVDEAVRRLRRQAAVIDKTDYSAKAGVVAILLDSADYFAALAAQGGCRVNPISGRVCERGTRSCEVEHEPAPARRERCVMKPAGAGEEG